MRAFALLLLAACWHSPAKPTPRDTPVKPSSPPAATGPHAFGPSTDDLAALYTGHALIDEKRGRVFVARNSGVDVLYLSTGKPAGHVATGWDGEIWGAGKRLLAFHLPAPQAIEATLVDHVTTTRVASCQRTLRAPANSHISRVDVFTYRGTTYLKWETAPPPEMHGGARMTNEQMAAWMTRFQAAYACGLLAVHEHGTACTLDDASYKDADLESCETREMPPPRLLASAIIGDVQYAIEDSGGDMTRPHTETSTLIVRDRSGTERWRAVVAEREFIPPAP